MKQSRPDNANDDSPQPGLPDVSPAIGRRLRLAIAVALHGALAVAAVVVVRWALPGTTGPVDPTQQWGLPTPPSTTAVAGMEEKGSVQADEAVAALPPSSDDVTPAVPTDLDATALASVDGATDEFEGSAGTRSASRPSRQHEPEVVPRVVEWPDGGSTRDATAAAKASGTGRAMLTARRDRVSDANTNRSTAHSLPPGGVRPEVDLPPAEVVWDYHSPDPDPVDVDWADPLGTLADAVLTTGQLRAAEIMFAPAERTDAGGTSPTQVTTTATSETQAAARRQEPIGGPVDAPSFKTGAFFGLPAGQKTVYLIDASGSLIDTLPYAVAEVRRAVATLAPDQSFAVVFFRGGEIVEAPPMGLQPATRRNIQQTLAWLDPRAGRLTANGRTNAPVALAHALSYEPDTVFLLSDGVVGLRDPRADRRQLIQMTERVRRRPRLHTVQFIDPDPLASRGRMGTLELLASLNNGQHRFVGIDDVQR